MQKKTGRELAEHKEKNKELIFSGASSLLTKPKDPKEVLERKLIVLTAKALKINPFGVNILGSLPYTNNIGRKEKLQEYSKGARFEYRWVQRATDDEMKAICEARLIDAKGKPLCDFVVGECSPKTIKMGPLQGYQNHMAQTRAENRAFEAAYGAAFRKDLFMGIERELKDGNTDTEMAEKALTAGKTSYEEAAAITPNARGTSSKASDEIYFKAMKGIAAAKDKATLEGYRDKMGTSKLYNPEQKEQLLRLINGRLETLA